MSNFSIGVMGEVAKGKRGVSYKPEDLVLEHRDEHFRLLTAGNIQDGITTTDSYTKVSAKCVSPEQQISPDDILVCMSNGSKRLVGKSSRLRSGESRYCVGAFCSTFSPVSGADPDYVFHLFQSEIFQRQVQDALEGSAINNLKNSMVESFEVPIPPLPEQKKIAEILSGIDRILTAYSCKKEKLLQLQSALRNEIFSSVKGENLTLEDICSPKQWPTIPTHLLTTSGYPVYGANGQIGYHTEYNHKDPVLAVTCRGATCGNINLVPALSYVTGNSMCLDNLHGNVSIDYLFHYLHWRGLKDVISGSAQPQITQAPLRLVQVVLPSLEKQTSIADGLESITRMLVSIGQIMVSLQLQKQAISSDLLSGRKRVSV